MLANTMEVIVIEIVWLLTFLKIVFHRIKERQRGLEWHDDRFFIYEWPIPLSASCGLISTIFKYQVLCVDFIISDSAAEVPQSVFSQVY